MVIRLIIDGIYLLNRIKSDLRLSGVDKNMTPYARGLSSRCSVLNLEVESRVRLHVVTSARTK
jgi:hypothetical protein